MTITAGAADMDEHAADGMVVLVTVVETPVVLVVVEVVDEVTFPHGSQLLPIAASTMYGAGVSRQPRSSRRPLAKSR